MSGKKKSKALPRRERSYPQLPRVFSIQAGIHPMQAKIATWVNYYSVRKLLDEYHKLFLLYRALQQHDLITISKYTNTIHPVRMNFKYDFVDELPITESKLWVPGDDAMKYWVKYEKLYYRCLKIATIAAGDDNG